MNLQFLLSTNIFFSGKLRFASCHDSASMESDLRGYQVVHMLTAHMHYFVICIVYFLWLNICSFQGRLLASRTLRARLPMSWNYRGGISERRRTLIKWNKACKMALWCWTSTSSPARVWSSSWPRRRGRGRPGYMWWILIAYARLFLIRVIPMWLCRVFRNCCKIIVFVIYNPTTTDPKGQYSPGCGLES